ncbi:MAG: GNAT family N-acetyltransferase [Pseudobdellovibrionaceae bacterium]
MNVIARKATSDEMDQIYMMGFDVWSDGSTQAEYLAGCRASLKYKSGTWYVLESSDQLVCSLITYNLGLNEIGIGSIATPIHFRKRGYASTLIKKVIDDLDVVLDMPTYFLYADISPKFYERFGFAIVPSELQKYKESSCMIRPRKNKYLFTGSTIPKYF